MTGQSLEVTELSETNPVSTVTTDHTKDVAGDELSFDHILSIAQSVSEGKLPYERLFDLMRHSDRLSKPTPSSRECELIKRILFRLVHQPSETRYRYMILRKL